jgi:hypothetical protein
MKRVCDPWLGMPPLGFGDPLDGFHVAAPVRNVNYYRLSGSNVKQMEPGQTNSPWCRSLPTWERQTRDGHLFLRRVENRRTPEISPYIVTCSPGTMKNPGWACSRSPERSDVHDRRNVPPLEGQCGLPWFVCSQTWSFLLGKRAWHESCLSCRSEPPPSRRDPFSR